LEINHGDEKNALAARRMLVFFGRRDLSYRTQPYRCVSASRHLLYRILKAKGPLILVPELLDSELRPETGYRSSLTAASPWLPFTR